MLAVPEEKAHNYWEVLEKRKHMELWHLPAFLDLMAVHPRSKNPSKIHVVLTMLHEDYPHRLCQDRDCEYLYLWNFLGIEK